MDDRDEMDEATMRLAALLNDLEARVKQAGTPYLACNELGTFLEDVNRAVGLIVGDRSLAVDSWHTAIAGHLGTTVHASRLSKVRLVAEVVRDDRNAGSHANVERHDLDWAEALRRLDDLREVVGRELPDLLGVVEFASRFADVQTASRPCVRARDAFQALSAASPSWDRCWSDIVEPAMQHVLPHAERTSRVFVAPQVPPANRVRSGLERLARVSGDVDHLVQVVDELISQTRCAPLKSWRWRDSLQAATRQHAGIPVMEIVVCASGSSSIVVDRLELRRLGVPAWLPVTERLDLPRRVAHADLGAFVLEVQRLINEASQQRRVEPPKWKEVVLRFQVPDELARLDFEESPHRGGQLASMFAAVAISPAPNTFLPRRETALVKRPPGGNSALEWTSSDIDDLRSTPPRVESLFVGPNGWRGLGPPPVFLAYHDIVLAVMCDAPAPDPFVGTLFGEDDAMPLAELFARLARVRREPARLKIKIIWGEEESHRAAAPPPRGGETA